MGKIDFKRLETLSESELIKEQQTWDADQWEAYYPKSVIRKYVFPWLCL